MQLSNQNFKNESHRAAAHIFVINCFLGLRFQDLYSLQSVHLQRIETPTYGVVTTIQRRQGKNGRLVLVPVPPFAQQLLDSYGGVLPFHLITKHKEALTQFNLIIKEAAEEAKLKSGAYGEDQKRGGEGNSLGAAQANQQSYCPPYGR